ncbi:MAG: hypothetical protein AAFN77_10055 [Planctomycetota bacterium]
MARLKWLVFAGAAAGLIALSGVYLAGGDLQLAGLAWLISFLGAIVGHLASEYPSGNEFILLRMASGTACRTLPAAGFALWVAKFRDPPVETSAIVVLIFIYLVGLAVDSYLSLQRIKPAT